MKPNREHPPYYASSMPAFVYWNREKKLSFPPAYHNDYEFQFIKKGQGSYYVAGKTYHFGPRNLITILPGQVHSFICQPDHPAIEKAGIIFMAKWMKDFEQLAEIDNVFPHMVALPDLSFVKIEMIINHIIEENKRREDSWEKMIRELLHEFIIRVTRLKNQAVKFCKEKPLFGQLCQYIGEHFTDPRCNVTDIASKFGYSLYYISSFFKQECGTGIKQYILQCRISAAREILDGNKNIKIESVAHQTGFNHYRDFARSFANLTGMTPSVYHKISHINR